MLILPAIDLIRGRCVRLVQGDYLQAKEYSHDPGSVARRFLGEGATFLHVIDLDGAKAGLPVNERIVLDIARTVNLPLQVGGGIRTSQDAARFLNAGIRRTIFGTSAIEDPSEVEKALAAFGSSRVVVSIDVLEDRIAVRGWQQASPISLDEFLNRLRALNVQRVVVTDIRRDGMLGGPNVGLVDRVLSQGFRTLVAGGVTCIDDLEKMKARGVEGVIIGKALYEGKIDLREAISTGRVKSDLAKRVIPCLDVRERRVVKGTHFKNFKDAGDPVALGKLYSERGADELVYLDITAATENRRTLLDLVVKVAEEINIPFTVGGGIRSIDDVRRLLRAGADKVSIGSAALLDPGLVRRVSQEFGAQCVVISVDAKKADRGWKIHIRDGTQATEKHAVAFSKEMEAAGAGELLVNSLDRDGTKKGFDIDLLREISESVNIPVVASSGAGTLADFLEVFRQTEVDAVLAASVFHYGEIAIHDLKKYLRENHIPVRLWSPLGKAPALLGNTYAGRPLPSGVGNPCLKTTHSSSWQEPEGAPSAVAKPFDTKGLNFDKLNGILPAVIQDWKTKEVLMLGFMNEEALKRTVEEGRVTFWSRSRKSLWLKGETSGHFLEVVSVTPDCDHDSLLISVRPTGPVCHTGRNSCFEMEESEKENLEFIKELYDLIEKRKREMPEGSYTASLFRQGIDRIAKKVGEESTEVVIASKNDSARRVIEESADLLYHLIVLLVEKGISLNAVIGELEDRHKPQPLNSR